MSERWTWPPTHGRFTTHDDDTYCGRAVDHLSAPVVTNSGEPVATGPDGRPRVTCVVCILSRVEYLRSRPDDFSFRAECAAWRKRLVEVESATFAQLGVKVPP